MTVGITVKRFIGLPRNTQRSPEREKLKELTNEFSFLIQRRNQILRGTPCTNSNGESRLNSTAILATPDLEYVAGAFVLCSSNPTDCYAVS